MKKLFLTFVAGLLAVQSLSAQTTMSDDFYAPGKRIGFAVGFGILDGITLEASTGLTKWCTARVGLDIMPDISYTYEDSYDISNGLNFDPNDPTIKYLNMKGVNTNDLQKVTKTDISLKGSLKRTQLHVLFDAYPFPEKSNFFVTGGFYFSGKKFFTVTGKVSEKVLTDAYQALVSNPEYASEASKLGIDISDYQIPFNENGDIEAGLGVSGFRPYLGFGFGRAIPKNRVGCRFEMGVQFHGSPSFVDADNNDLDLLNKGTDDDIKKWMDKLTVMPVLKFSVRGRIL